MKPEIYMWVKEYPARFDPQNGGEPASTEFFDEPAPGAFALIRLSDYEARVKQLEEALRPFVGAADATDFIRGNPDEVFIWGENGGENPRTISVSDLRRARALLNGGCHDPS